MRPHHCFMYPEGNRRGLKRVQPNADSRAAIFMRSSKPSTHDSETAQVQPNTLVKIIFIVCMQVHGGAHEVNLVRVETNQKPKTLHLQSHSRDIGLNDPT